MKLLNLYNLSILCLSFLIVGFYYVNKEGEKEEARPQAILLMKVTNPRLIENWMHQIELENDRVKDKFEFDYTIDTIEENQNEKVQPLFKYIMNGFLYNNSRDTIYYLSSSCDGIASNFKCPSCFYIRAMCYLNNPIKVRILPYEELTFKLGFLVKNIDDVDEPFEAKYELIALPKSFEIEGRFRAIEDLRTQLRKKKEYLSLPKK